VFGTYHGASTIDPLISVSCNLLDIGWSVGPDPAQGDNENVWYVPLAGFELAVPVSALGCSVLMTLSRTTTMVLTLNILYLPHVWLHVVRW
jgi:hypothetical protein